MPNELVLRGRRLLGSSGHVQRDDLVRPDARRLLGSTQFGLLRNEFVLRGRRLLGQGGDVQRDDLVSAAIDGPIRTRLLFDFVLVSHLLCRREQSLRRCDQLQRDSVVQPDTH